MQHKKASARRSCCKGHTKQVLPSFRCLCAVTAQGWKSRKVLFFAENYLAGHLEHKISAKSWEQLGYNCFQVTAESCRQTGEGVLVAEIC